VEPTGLTCDLWVTKVRRMGSVTERSPVPDPADEAVFRALADPTRRAILDGLFERDGQSLGEIERAFDMSRFGVMKHLRVLEEAGLVTTHRVGRSKLHFLNPVPIRLIHDRWIDKYTEHRVSALADLKHELEDAG
jgi:DNA-binding transcriptional ArsR family regulator